MKRSTRLTTSAAVLLLAGVAHAQGDRGRGRGQGPKTIPPQEQQQRVSDQRRRDTAYKTVLADQVRSAQQASAALQQQKRSAQYTVNQQYAANLRLQQQRLNTPRDVERDPYYSAPMTYRYTVGSTDRETNRFGADVMRQAVNNGYQQGFKAGRADRKDRWPSNYQQSNGYRDANFGYSGNYLPQSDYNYYFREGFRRGYEDGFARHSQYGTVVNGSPSILANILTGILGLHNIG
ncbi:MAG TPA: hypothetical protein VGQ44_14430 [Gemmatimonadaceae bacterium]|nr:hypothetical protein [Gemmatimonadaceae bacterium]